MQFNVLLVLIVSGGWLFGRIFKKIAMPPVLGMLIWGIVIGNFFKNSIPPILKEIEPTLKSIALIVILLRAGLGIQKKALAESGKTAFLMSFVPCLIEGAALTFIFYFLFNFSFFTAGAAAWMMAAVSPAVVVPSMLDLKENGKNNKVATIILAGASADDVFAITLFSVFLNLTLTGSENLIKAAVSIPFALIGGIFFGYIAGLAIAKFFEKKYKKIRATEKTILMLSLSLLFVEIGSRLHLAAFLTVMTCGFIILLKANHVASELSSKLSKIWILAEIFLFVLIGMAVDLNFVATAGLLGIAALFTGLFFRSIGVILSTFFSGLNFKERLFCVIAYTPKATVQAALGSVPLAYGIDNGELILAFAVLAIAVTAPLGLVGIKLGRKYLLNERIEK